MLRMVTLLKRRPGLSIEQFVDYYEDAHAKLGGSYLRRHAISYTRSYLRGMPNPLTGEEGEPEHDVLTEVCYSDRAAWEQSMRLFGEPEIAAAMIADEEHLFDRGKTRMFLVEDVRTSDLTA